MGRLGIPLGMFEPSAYKGATDSPKSFTQLGRFLG